MNIDFPKQFSHLLDKYNITKEFNKNKSFLLELDNIPDLIYGKAKSKDYWFIAEGKGGLYTFETYIQTRTYSLNEIHRNIENVSYNLIIGYLKDNKHLAPHPISGRMTEWDARSALEICNKLHKRIPELEPAIAHNYEYSYCYARDIIKGRFELGEKIISTNHLTAYLYAKKIINSRFALGEEAISFFPEYSYKYAVLLEKRFELGERAIAENSYYAYAYARDILHDRFPLGENKIAESGYYSYLYAGDVLKERFRLGEDKISYLTQNYVEDYMKDFNLEITEEGEFVEK